MASHITKNRAGTYVFQFRLPRHILHNIPDLNPIIWRSLRTKDRREANRRAKRLWLVIDHLLVRFEDPKVFAKAMELLKRYDDASKDGSYMKFLESLDDTLEGGESDLLERVLQYRTEFRQQQERGLDLPDVRKLVESIIADSKEPVFTEENNLLLSDLVDKYMLEHINGGLAPGSRKPYETKLMQFVSVLQALNEDQPVRLSDVDASKMRTYAELMGKFPSNHKTQKTLKHLSFTKMVAFVLEHDSRAELEAKGIKIMRGSGECFRLVRSLLSYGRKKGFPVREGLEAIVESSGSRSRKRSSINANDAYSREELQKLFRSDDYLHARHKLAVDYWGPLISLHTGATLAEICQLHISDIRNENGIDIIDINALDEKRLKNDDGRPRWIPIHSNLKKLGFFDFVESRRKRGGKRLFPEAVRNKEDKFDSTGKRYARFRKRCGVTGKEREKTFHSFRSTVSTELLQRLGCPEGRANEIIGHVSGYRASETKQTYAKGVTMAHLTRPWVEKLDFGIDFNYPKLWRDKRSK